MPHIAQWAQPPQQETLPFFLSLTIFTITRATNAVKASEINIVPMLLPNHAIINLPPQSASSDCLLILLEEQHVDDHSQSSDSEQKPYDIGLSCEQVAELCDH